MLALKIAKSPQQLGVRIHGNATLDGYDGPPTALQHFGQVVLAVQVIATKMFKLQRSECAALLVFNVGVHDRHSSAPCPESSSQLPRKSTVITCGKLGSDARK
jgi:hypothetical protein